MSRASLAVVAVAVLVISACTDRQEPTAPQGAVSPAISAASVSADAAAFESQGVSTICLVNRKALADLDGQLQENPEDETLQAQHAAQSEITTDVCD